jgi:hypothetical protein
MRPQGLGVLWYSQGSLLERDGVGRETFSDGAWTVKEILDQLKRVEEAIEKYEASIQKAKALAAESKRAADFQWSQWVLTQTGENEDREK